MFCFWNLSVVIYSVLVLYHNKTKWFSEPKPIEQMTKQFRGETNCSRVETKYVLSQPWDKTRLCRTRTCRNFALLSLCSVARGRGGWEGGSSKGGAGGMVIMQYDKLVHLYGLTFWPVYYILLNYIYTVNMLYYIYIYVCMKKERTRGSCDSCLIYKYIY